MSTDDRFDILGLAVTIQRRRGVSHEEAVARAIAMRDGHSAITPEVQAEPSSNALAMRDVQQLPCDQLALRLVDASKGELSLEAAQNAAFLAKERHHAPERRTLPALSEAEHAWLVHEAEKAVRPGEMAHLALSDRNPLSVAAERVRRISLALQSGASNAAAVTDSAVQAATGGKLAYRHGHICERGTP
jgi:hypothetical protein